LRSTSRDRRRVRDAGCTRFAPDKSTTPTAWRHRLVRGKTILVPQALPAPSGAHRARNRDANGGTAVLIAGTRPECIKLAPLIQRLDARGRLRAYVVNSGQHADAVRQTFARFGIRCDIDLAALPAHPNLVAACTQMRDRLSAVLGRLQPAVTVVQGDTLTAYAGARAARAAGSVVAHVEAGLRTDSVSDPFPEEWFRRRIARTAHLHFAPSRSAEINLLREGTDPRTIHRVGNTGIDALRALLAARTNLHLHAGTPPQRVLVTLHRRENWDRNAEIVCDALLDLVGCRPSLQVLFPVHPNPRIARRLHRRLGAHPAFTLTSPLPYPEFVRYAAGAALIISDSGGIQEEAPHLGVPLLVPRANTERGESLATGFVRLVATDRERIVEAALEMLSAPRQRPLPFDAEAPFGAGDAAIRIVDILEQTLPAVRAQ
jgi:UDP-N-acetylglucosamine 2-epimerase (non-hydrolysing)